MGFLQVIRENEAEPEQVKEIWRDALIIKGGQRVRTIEMPLKNGHRVLLCPEQYVARIKNGRIAGCLEEAGGYLYHEELPEIEMNEAYKKFMEEYFVLSGIVTAETQLICFDYTDRFDVGELLIDLVDELTPTTEEEDEEDEEFSMQQSGTEARANETSIKEATADEIPRERAATPPAVKNFCPKCGQNLQMYTGIRFCPGCGGRLN